MLSIAGTSYLFSFLHISLLFLPFPSFFLFSLSSFPHFLPPSFLCPFSSSLFLTIAIYFLLRVELYTAQTELSLTLFCVHFHLEI